MDTDALCFAVETSIEDLIVAKTENDWDKVEAVLDRLQHCMSNLETANQD